ncbi:hypothetical protein [Modicisalibacter coralii]|uniref:hypothetical protein n=1 Tax=Modicisalibacter coralii TaxID=2304602 RepID=UPI00100BE4AB|nr:hypothetical protein [Halomonas coralii]
MDFLKTILAVLVSSYLTMMFAMTRFRSERIWERRADAYSKTIRCLHRHKDYAENYIDHLSEHQSDYLDGKIRKLSLQSQKATSETREALEINYFFLSSDAISVINKFLAGPNFPPGYEEYMDQEEIATQYLELAEESISNLHTIARRELGDKEPIFSKIIRHSSIIKAKITRGLK